MMFLAQSRALCLSGLPGLNVPQNVVVANNNAKGKLFALLSMVALLVGMP
jgi:hypothetical protein